MKEFITLQIDELKPYENNPRINDDAVDDVVKSFEECGYLDPIEVDENNIILSGHTRLKALKRLGFQQAEVIRYTGLTETQKKRYRYLANKTGEKAKWDLEKLQIEFEQPDFSEYGFDFEIEPVEYDEFTQELEHFEHKQNTQFLKENILNLAYAQFDGVGDYDIPMIEGVKEFPDVDEWIGFNYVLSDKRTDEEKARTGVHFFVDDYQFERVWNEPNKYIDKLAKYGAVLSPDFSPYGDMPIVTQMFNHYRKHWIAAYWQMSGITVIATIRASTDERSLKWFLDGEPKNSIVAYSSMWFKENSDNEYGIREWQTMVDTLKPSGILVYGKQFDFMQGNIKTIEKFTDKRWN